MATTRDRLKELRDELARLRESPMEQAILDLEREARELMQETIGGEQSDASREFLRDVISFRKEHKERANSDTTSTDVEEALRAAETSILSGAIGDLREAVRHLDRVLQQEPQNAAAYNLLTRLIEQPNMPRHEVEELLNSVDTPKARQLLRDLSGSASNSHTSPPPHGQDTYQDSYTSSQHTTGGGGTSSSDPEVERLQQLMVDTYYRGDYKETVKVCVAILNIDPHNSEAQKFQAKAEDYIQRGVVPDSKIPLDARIAFNRGVSAMRAGNYEDARNLFDTAIRTARDKGGVERWTDAENALLEIENLAMAKELRQQGDGLAQDDQWEDALEKYEGALALVDDPRSRKKYEALKTAQQLYQQVGVQLELLSGRLVKQAKGLQELRTNLTEARRHLPQSAKLSKLLSTVDSRAAALSAELENQGRSVAQQAQRVFTLQDRIRLLEQAFTYLETARDLVPSGDDTSHLEIQADLERAKQVMELMDRAERYLNQRDPASLDEARGHLRTISDELSEYVSDPRYRSLLTKLQRYFLENVEVALSDPTPDLERIRSQLHMVKEAPFNVLGHSTDARHLEGRLRELEAAARRAIVRQRVQIALMGVGGLIVILILGLLTRPIWNPIVNPPPTSTPTLTPTSTLTPTPSNTPTQTLTPTPRPTEPTELCLGITRAASAYYVRGEPDINSATLGTVPPERRVRILDQTRDKEGVLWYKIDYGDSSIIQQGWIMAQYVVEVTECPRLD